MTKVKLNNGDIVTINDGKCKGPNKGVTAMLNDMARHLPYYGKAWLWDVDLYIAEELIKEAGGTLVHHDALPPPADVDTIIF